MPDPADHLVPLAEFEAARGRIDGIVHRTPLLSSATAAAWTTVATGARLADDRLYVKAEHLQKTGSFKSRGMTELDRDAPRRGPGTGRDHALGRERGSGLRLGRANGGRGGHGRDAGRRRPLQGRGLSRLRRTGRPPRHARRRGAGRARTAARCRGLEFVHPFDDPAVIAGHGSVGLELLDDLPDVDVVVVGVGGGGLISGVAGAIKQLRPGRGSTASSPSSRTR